MQQSPFVNIDGKLLKENKVSISPNNRSFRYGDGFFETMKMIQGKIMAESYHEQRFSATLQQLQFDCPSYFNFQYLKKLIEELAYKNQHNALARIRLTIFRGNGGLYDPDNLVPHFLIQTWLLNPANNTLNNNGLVIDIYKDALKSCDRFANLKTNNYLGYAMAALWAKQQHLNDALLLNSNDQIADSTIANLFIVKNNHLYTPALTEGPVRGTTRQFLIDYCRQNNIPVTENALSINDLLNADEVFLTNAIYGIKWVKMVGNQLFLQHQFAKELHHYALKPLWQL